MKEIDDSLCSRKFTEFKLTNCSQIQNYSKFFYNVTVRGSGDEITQKLRNF